MVDMWTKKIIDQRRNFYEICDQINRQNISISINYFIDTRVFFLI